MNIYSDLIPLSTPYKRRPGYKLKALDYITIHNTGNPSSVAKGERSWLTNPANTRQASFHIVIDQVDIIECVPTGLSKIFPKTTAAEVAWHAGDGGSGTGNTRSIGIEICESGDFNKTMLNAVAFVAKILFLYNKPISILKQHYNWSGKDCPRILRRNGLWDKFLKDVQAEVNRLKPAPVTTNPTPMIDSWEINMGSEAVDFLTKEGLLTKPDDWKKKLNEKTPNWLFFEMNKRLYEKIMKEIEALKK